MREWLVSLVGESLAPIVAMILAGLLVLVLILVVVALFKKVAGGSLGIGSRSAMPRLAVLDVTAVDPKRKLVLVRRDDVEHLLMIGGPNDLVVETTIQRTATGSGPRREPAIASGPMVDSGRPRSLTQPAEPRTASLPAGPVVVPAPVPAVSAVPLAPIRSPETNRSEPRQTERGEPRRAAAPAPSVGSPATAPAVHRDEKRPQVALDRAEPVFASPSAASVPRVEPATERMATPSPQAGRDPEAPRQPLSQPARAPIVQPPRDDPAPRAPLAPPVEQRSMVTPVAPPPRPAGAAGPAPIVRPTREEAQADEPAAPTGRSEPVRESDSQANASIIHREPPVPAAMTPLPPPVKPILDASGQPARQPLSVRSFASSIQNHRVDPPVSRTPAPAPTPAETNRNDEDNLADLLAAEFEPSQASADPRPTPASPEVGTEDRQPVPQAETLEDEMERLLRDFTLDPVSRR